MGFDDDQSDGARAVNGGEPKLSFAARGQDLRISFEFFPPANDAMMQTLWKSVRRLEPLAPRFVSVTYGAGGTTRERTHKTVTRIQSQTALNAAAHLTCVGATRQEVDDVARHYWQSGIKHVVALRGDPPAGTGRFEAHPGGYQDAADLVAGLMRVHDFEISVAAYPELHPDATSTQQDLDHLRRKVDNGAKVAITQFFFDPTAYLRFLEKARAAGIWVPIVPGILPVTNFARTVKFAEQCGARIPAKIARIFEDLDDDPSTRQLLAAIVAAEICNHLREAGVRDFHFFTLNRAELSYAICHRLGVRPVEEISSAQRHIRAE